jgi:hypothetical protein
MVAPLATDPEAAGVAPPVGPTDADAAADPAGPTDDEARADSAADAAADPDGDPGATDPAAPDDGLAAGTTLASGGVVPLPLPHAATAIAARSRAVDAVINRDIDTWLRGIASPTRRVARGARVASSAGSGRGPQASPRHEV